jgi:hypothetical protein
VASTDGEEDGAHGCVFPLSGVRWRVVENGVNDAWAGDRSVEWRGGCAVVMHDQFLLCAPQTAGYCPC